MRTKKSNFSTLFFSLLPGAGHMYMGFMKMGISFMSAFFFTIFFSSWLNIGPILFIVPLIWFYSFFDCINKQHLSDEEFSLIEDNYLFSFDKFIKVDKNIFKKRRLFVGVILLFFGLYLIWNNIIDSLNGYISNEVYIAISNFTRIVPQIVVGAAIIIVGIKLIIGKKKENDMND